MWTDDNHLHIQLPEFTVTRTGDKTSICALHESSSEKGTKIANGETKREWKICVVFAHIFKIHCSSTKQSTNYRMVDQ